MDAEFQAEVRYAFRALLIDRSSPSPHLVTSDNNCLGLTFKDSKQILQRIMLWIYREFIETLLELRRSKFLFAGYNLA